MAGRINPTHPIGVEAGFRPHVIHVEVLYQRSRMLFMGFYPVAIKEHRRAGCLLTIRVRICGWATNAGFGVRAASPQAGHLGQSSALRIR